ncbi:ATP-dependent DNA helicase [Comamonas aquatilis]|uniref:ATP-dependent DNA helicase n=1 Tax=Comamonas aquatilis TaxID=1778406 RepID=UPI0039F0BAB5
MSAEATDHSSAPAVVGVRALCEFTARSGDLDLRFTPSPTSLEGMEGHATVRRRRAAGYESEISLGGQYLGLRVQGRADGFDAAACRLEEIKTYRGTLDGIRPNHRALHWAQAKVYAHLLCQARQLAQINVALVYFHVGSGEETVLSSLYAADELQLFFDSQCQRYLAWARGEAAHRALRNTALQALDFPHAQFRAGQRQLAVAVYRTAASPAPANSQGDRSGDEPEDKPGDTKAGGRSLMAQASTGIGKTLGTIFPLLKAMPGQGLDKLFFLTAKTTGHALALDALAQLQQSTAPGVLRVLDLQARDKACEHPDKACHGDSCPLAQGFYDRLPAAREQAVSLVVQDAPAVRSVALAHGICPYYLMQELTRWADVVVGDYNYYYDSCAMLYALTQAQGWKAAVLVDEAHNLLDRARRMYTAELSQFVLHAARKQAGGRVKKALDGLNRAWNALNKVQHHNYQSYAEPPSSLLNAVQRAISAIAEVQADQPLPPADPVLALYWELLQFQSLAEAFGPHALFDINLATALPGRSGRSGSAARAPFSTLCIRNVLPAPHLLQRHAAAHTSVLFSGTLSPPQFYRDMLGLPAHTAWLEVDAPFKAEQLSVQVAGHISTRWHDRQASLQPIADIVARQFALQPGNYLCFCSSFDYLQQVAQELTRLHPGLPMWSQTPAMDDASRTQFLARFVQGGRGIGFAVLGGVFSEGVDLPGSRLIGAFVATLGLPQVNPVNEAMKQALDDYWGRDAAHKQAHRQAQGYDYTYLYPGLRKVVQAAGRVIRTESDRGVVVLMDDRFQRADVQALLPKWWRLEHGSFR